MGGPGAEENGRWLLLTEACHLHAAEYVSDRIQVPGPLRVLAGMPGCISLQHTRRYSAREHCCMQHVCLGVCQQLASSCWHTWAFLQACQGALQAALEVSQPDPPTASTQANGAYADYTGPEYDMDVSEQSPLKSFRGVLMTLPGVYFDIWTLPSCSFLCQLPWPDSFWPSCFPLLCKCNANRRSSAAT